MRGSTAGHWWLVDNIRVVKAQIDKFNFRKTYTMSQVIAQVNKPTLVHCPQ